MSTEQKQFTALNKFIKPPPSKEELKGLEKEQIRSESNDKKGPIRKGQQQL